MEPEAYPIGYTRKGLPSLTKNIRLGFKNFHQQCSSLLLINLE